VYYSGSEKAIEWVPGVLTVGVEQLQHEADHSPPSHAEVKVTCNYTSTPPIHLHGVVLD